MSKETHDAVEAAIRAHIADEVDEPRIVTDWVVLTVGEGLDPNVNGYFYISARIPAHTIKGMLLHFLDRFRYDHLTEENDQ